MSSLAPTRTLASARVLAPSRTLAPDRVDSPPRGGDAPILPNALTGLQLWLDASTIALPDGSAVQTWPDLSGNGNDAVQATISMRPILRSTTSVVALPNNKPVVAFDNINDFMAGTLPALAQPITLILVALRGTAPTGDTLFFDGEAKASGTNRMLLRYNSGGPLNVFAGSSVNATGGSVVGYHSYSLVLSGAASHLYQDGGELTLSGSPGTVGISGAHPGYVLNQYADQTASVGQVSYAEIALYNRALSTAERQGLENYLRDKYGTP